MLRSLVLFFFLSTLCWGCGQQSNLFVENSTDNRLTRLSRQFLNASITRKQSEALADSLCSLSPEQLSKQLDDKARKLTFWINIYNGFIQYRLRKNPEAYQERSAFFQDKEMCIAGMELSFDDIEHGIIRGSEWKFGLGYIDQPFPDSSIKAWKIAKTDPRIHFALNCGAKDCPPMRIYSASQINQELNKNSQEYLLTETIVRENKIYVPKILSWYRGDLGGKQGIRQALLKYEVIEKEQAGSISFKNYDWTLDLNNFSGELTKPGTPASPVKN